MLLHSELASVLLATHNEFHQSTNLKYDISLACTTVSFQIFNKLLITNIKLT